LAIIIEEIVQNTIFCFKSDRYTRAFSLIYGVAQINISPLTPNSMIGHGEETSPSLKLKLGGIKPNILVLARHYEQNSLF